MSKKSKFNSRGVGISRNDYDDDYEDRPSKREEKKRRPVRNWKRAWDRHQTDYDDYDEFYGK